MNRTWLILAFLLSLSIKTTAQDCYTKNWIGNGLDQMNLYITGITLNGETLAEPAQVGVFDGEECVAVVDYESTMPTSGFLAFKASSDDATTPDVIDGFKAGNTINYKLCLSGDKEVTEITATYSSGSGIFAQSGTAVFTLSATANNAPKVENSIDDLILNEGFVTRTVELAGVFTDPDGDDLTLTPSSSDEDVVTVGISGTTLTITEVGIGPANVTINASDGVLSVDDVFNVTVSLTTDIGSLSENNIKIKAFPNPSKGQVSLIANRSLNSLSQACIVNSSGITVETCTVSQIIADEPFKINFGKLRSGIYFIHISNKEINEVIKVMLEN